MLLPLLRVTVQRNAREMKKKRAPAEANIPASANFAVPEQHNQSSLIAPIFRTAEWPAALITHYQPRRLGYVCSFSCHHPNSGDLLDEIRHQVCCSCTFSLCGAPAPAATLSPHQIPNPFAVLCNAEPKNVHRHPGGWKQETGRRCWRGVGRWCTSAAPGTNAASTAPAASSACPRRRAPLSPMHTAAMHVLQPFGTQHTRSVCLVSWCFIDCGIFGLVYRSEGICIDGISIGGSRVLHSSKLACLLLSVLVDQSNAFAIIMPLKLSTEPSCGCCLVSTPVYVLKQRAAAYLQLLYMSRRSQ